MREILRHKQLGNHHSQHDFGNNMKSINEFIGALQTQKVTLKKIQIMLENSRHTKEDFKQNLNDFLLKHFMGIPIFECNLLCNINGICINSFISFKADFDTDEFIALTEEYIHEVDELLMQCNDALSMDIDDRYDDIDFNNIFRK